MEINPKCNSIVKSVSGANANGCISKLELSAVLILSRDWTTAITKFLSDQLNSEARGVPDRRKESLLSGEKVLNPANSLARRLMKILFQLGTTDFADLTRTANRCKVPCP